MEPVPCGLAGRRSVLPKVTLVSKAANVEMDHGPHWAHECLDMTPRQLKTLPREHF